MKVLISTRSFARADPRPLQLLRDSGLDPVLNPHGRKLTPEESIKLLHGAVGLIAGTEQLDDFVFSRVPSLRVISRVGVGLDNIDQDAACRRGVRVFSTPDAPALAVAELTLGCMLSILRHIPACDAALRRGQWSGLLGRQLSGATVGIIGFGRVGRQVARLLAPFKPKLLAYDLMQLPEHADALGVCYVELDELLACSDIVTLHLALTEKSQGFLNAARLNMMKQGAVLLNLARGGLVDEDALFDVLQSGRLAGAALDTFIEEPYRGLLISLPQVVLTPHIASNTQETRRQMELEAVENLLTGLRSIKNAAPRGVRL